MVLQKEGEMEFSLLTHSDDLKRVSTRTQRFVQIFFFQRYIFCSTNYFWSLHMHVYVCVCAVQHVCAWRINDILHFSLSSRFFLCLLWIDIFMVRLTALHLHWLLHCLTNMECTNWVRRKRLDTRIKMVICLFALLRIALYTLFHPLKWRFHNDFSLLSIFQLPNTLKVPAGECIPIGE